MSDGHGEMPRLFGRFAGGQTRRLVPTITAEASVLSAEAMGRPLATKVDEGRHVGPTGGKEASRVIRSVHHRVFRPLGRVRPGRRRAQQLPGVASCVAGAGRTEVSSGC